MYLQLKLKTVKSGTEREITHRERDQLLGRKLHREYLLGDTDQVNRIEEGKLTNNGSFTK